MDNIFEQATQSLHGFEITEQAIRESRGYGRAVDSRELTGNR
jgi:hypothetical protein